MTDLNPYASRPGHDSPARGGRQLVAIALLVGVLLNFGPRVVDAIVDVPAAPAQVAVVGP